MGMTPRKPFGVLPVVDSNGLMSIDLGFRGAVVGLSLLIAAVLLRDSWHSTVSRLGAALLVGAAASAICSAPYFRWPWPWWGLLLLELSSGNSVVFWLWARATFDDDLCPPALARCLVGGNYRLATLRRRLDRAVARARAGDRLDIVVHLSWTGFAGCGANARNMARGSGGRTAEAPNRPSRSARRPLLPSPLSWVLAPRLEASPALSARSASADGC